MYKSATLIFNLKYKYLADTSESKMCKMRFLWKYETAIGNLPKEKPTSNIFVIEQDIYAYMPLLYVVLRDKALNFGNIKLKRRALLFQL